ncbi:MAG: hypothetical protein IT428_09280, partial [Planctomycetaceae bacterium]|nr:hypothetical protein [Planctomycetaceae bacterium]
MLIERFPIVWLRTNGHWWSLSLPDTYLLGLALWCGGGVLALIGLLKMRRRWRGRPGRQKALAATLSLWFCLAILTFVEIGFALFYDTTDSFTKTAVSERWYAR